MEKIYILKNNKLFIGPYSREKLKQKSLKASDLIWYEGLSDWTPAEQVDFLKEIIIHDQVKVENRKSLKHKLINFFSRKY